MSHKSHSKLSTLRAGGRTPMHPSSTKSNHKPSATLDRHSSSTPRQMTRDTRPDGRSSKRPPKKSDRLRDPHPPLMSSLHGLSGLDPTHDSSEAENFDTSLIYNDALGEANNSSQPKPFDASSIYDGVPAAEPSSKSRSRRRRRSGKRSKPDGLATSILDAIREVPGITKLFPKRIFKP